MKFIGNLSIEALYQNLILACLEKLKKIRRNKLNLRDYGVVQVVTVSFHK